MAGSMIGTINKLQKAINAKNGRVIINHTQFYSEQSKRAIGQYTIKQAYWNEEKGRTESYELFSSYSQLQTVLFLRDYWFHMNHWKIPEDNKEWIEFREKYYASHAQEHMTIYEEDKIWEESGKLES